MADILAPDILEAHAEFVQCVQRIKMYTYEAWQLCSSLFQDADLSIPSSEPTAFSPHVSFETWDDVPLRCYHVDASTCDLKEIYRSWKRGTAAVPSIEFMNQKFGTFAFASDPAEQEILYLWSRIVQEIQHHLEFGRDLDEVLSVANIHFAAMDGSIPKLAQYVIECQKAGEQAFFVPGSSNYSSI